MNNQFCEQIVAQSIYFINLLFTLMGSLPDISGTMTSLGVTIVNGLETANDDYDDDDDDDAIFRPVKLQIYAYYDVNRHTRMYFKPRPPPQAWSEWDSYFIRAEVIDDSSYTKCSRQANSLSSTHVWPQVRGYRE